MKSYRGIEDLEAWDARIFEKAEAFGLDCYPQQFEICDNNQMLSAMAYSGVPSHYPHWSYGKAYEKQKTLYDHGVTGLPYEMVINSNPCLSYLMRDNSLLLQILTIAHVYGHNDFFKNNFTFRTTRSDYTIDRFKIHGERIRSYIEDPSITAEAVEKILDAAHALSLQGRRNLAIRKHTSEEARDILQESSQPQTDPFQSIHRRNKPPSINLHKVPLIPDEDLLLFIRDHNPRLSAWEKDVLTIVHDETQYFIPQIETKIMNEGWATFWHKQILEALDLPQDLHLEFIVRHNQVVRPFEYGLNPYHIGLVVWQDIYDRSAAGASGDEAGDRTSNGRMENEDSLFEVRETDRDSSFLRRHLSEELVRKLNLFELEDNDDQKVVRNIADKEGWRSVRDALVKSVGMNSVPVIKVEDADFGKGRCLYLVHYHDGRDLQLEYAEKALSYLSRLWHGEVVLETTLSAKKQLLVYGEEGFAMKAL